MTLTKKFGKHYLLELISCDPDKINIVRDVEKTFLNVAEKTGATILNYYFHQFEPSGVSGFILISESHMSLHTWPKEKYVAVDIFTCGEKMDIERGVTTLIEGFKASEAKRTTVVRGF